MTVCTHIDQIELLELPDRIEGARSASRSAARGCTFGCARAAAGSAAAT